MAALGGLQGWQGGAQEEKGQQGTYVFLGDIADVPDVHDLALVPHHAHGDGVLAHLGGDVPVHLDAQVLQHQQACREPRGGAMSPVPTCATPQGCPPSCSPLGWDPQGWRRQRRLPWEHPQVCPHLLGAENMRFSVLTGSDLQEGTAFGLRLSDTKGSGWVLHVRLWWDCTKMLHFLDLE